MDRFWQQSQATLARQLGGPLLVAADAGHQIPREAPQLVAFAVDQVVWAARAGRSTAEVDASDVAKVAATVAPAI
jgi:hypothetical protein